MFPYSGMGRAGLVPEWPAILQYPATGLGRGSTGIDNHGAWHQQGDPGRQPRQRSGREVHPGRHGHRHAQRGNHILAQGPRRQLPGKDRVAPGQAVWKDRRSRRRVPEEGPSGLYRRPPGVRQLREGRGQALHHRHHRRRHADAGRRRWPALRWWLWRGSPATQRGPAPRQRPRPAGGTGGGRAAGRRRLRRLRRRRHPVRKGLRRAWPRPVRRGRAGLSRGSAA